MFCLVSCGGQCPLYRKAIALSNLRYNNQQCSAWYLVVGNAHPTKAIAWRSSSGILRFGSFFNYIYLLIESDQIIVDYLDNGLL